MASAKIIPIRSFRATQFHEYRKAIGENYAHAFAHLDAGEQFPMFAFASKPLAEIIPLFAFASELAERIAQATQEAHAGIHKLSNEQLKPLLKELKEAEKSVRQAIMDFDHDPRNTTQALRLANLNSLKTQIDAAIDNAVKNQTLLPGVKADDAMQTGLLAGVNDLRAQEAAGGWGNLTAAQAVTASEAAFALVDGAALSFLSAYRLELAGTVADDLKNKIKSALTTGIVNGEPLYEISRKLGHVITDPEKFRQAGGMLFPSAANRLQLIVKTENMRAHNQGRVAFYSQVGIEHVRWIVAGRNTCADCQQYNDVVFALEKLPPQPLHPDCECTIVGERMESTKTPADYGIDDFGTDEEGGKIVVGDEPKTDIRIPHSWPNQPGRVYFTDAPKVYQNHVDLVAKQIELDARLIGLEIPELNGGVRFKWSQIAGNKGIYKPVTKRIDIPLLTKKNELRLVSKLSHTGLEEIIHHKTLVDEWFKIVDGAWIPQGEVGEIIIKSMVHKPSNKFLRREWRIARYDKDQGKRHAQFTAKMIRQMRYRPSVVQKEYPELYRFILQFLGK